MRSHAGNCRSRFLRNRHSHHAAVQDLGATRRSCSCDILLPIGAIRRANRLEGVTERAPELPGSLPEPSCSSAEDHGGYERGQLNNPVSEVSDHHPEGSSRSPELETRPGIRLHSQGRGLPSRSLSHNPRSTRHRQGRNHHQLPRSQGPLLIRVIDTSAWIG